MIATKFCTSHNSTVKCVVIWSSSIEIKWKYFYIWIMSEKSLVKWTRGTWFNIDVSSNSKHYESEIFHYCRTGSLSSKLTENITMTSWWARWRLKSPASRVFIQAQIKENIKALRCWPAGNSPVTGEFPAQRASYAENASIWWRHHGKIILRSFSAKYRKVAGSGTCRGELSS